MPKGTPLWMKCPKCKRGRHGHPPAVKGVMPTGRVEARRSKSAHKGHGSGGATFRGYRGIVKCGDCGYEWASTHPVSGRRRPA